MLHARPADDMLSNEVAVPKEGTEIVISRVLWSLLQEKTARVIGRMAVLAKE
jgi:hypothetical protein